MRIKWTTGGQCSECKTPFDGLHLVNKTTCSAKCRKRRERRQKDAHSAWILAMNELGKMRESLKRQEDVQTFVTQLQRLRSEINDLLLLAREPDAVARQEMLQERAIKRSSTSQSDQRHG